MTALPASTLATASAATEGDVKNFLTGQRDYLSGLFGDTGVAADARAALGVAALTSASIAAALGYTPLYVDTNTSYATTNYAIGTTLAVLWQNPTTLVNLAASSVLYIYTSSPGSVYAYKNSGAGLTALSGTWRMRGLLYDSADYAFCIFQRVA